MKNRDLKLAHYPTPAELYALDRAARKARAAEIARLARVAVARIKNLFSTSGVKGMRHA